jgi:hypothetical protein
VGPSGPASGPRVTDTAACRYHLAGFLRLYFMFWLLPLKRLALRDQVYKPPSPVAFSPSFAPSSVRTYPTMALSMILVMLVSIPTARDGRR